MKTYLFKAKHTQSEVTFKYDLNGFLIGFEVNKDVDEKQHYWLLKNMPLKENQLLAYQKTLNNIKITLIPEDLSFENFYKLYNYKQKKKMAENAWNKLSKLNKQKAIAYIEAYNNKIRMSGAAKAYPSSYLNQEYFND